MLNINDGKSGKSQNFQGMQVYRIQPEMLFIQSFGLINHSNTST